MKSVPNSTENKLSTEITGYLFEKRQSKWKRGYYKIENNILSRQKVSKEENISATEIVMVNLLLATIRPARDVERRLCFEIVSPADNFIFQAESEQNYNTWLQVSHIDVTKYLKLK